MSGVRAPQETFTALVAEALDNLPEDIRAYLENVEVVVEAWPDAQTLRLAGVQHPAQLLGFYHGIPRTRRSRHYTLVLPDKISLYQRPIELRCHSLTELRHTIAHVIRHEIAHHFGLSDERLRQIGAY